MLTRHFILLFSVMALAAVTPASAQTTAAQETDSTIQIGSTVRSATVLLDTIAEDKTQLKELTGNECDISNDPNTTNPCSLLKLVADNLGAVKTYSANDPIIGARTMANAQAQIAIDAWGYCRYVNNDSTHSLFVPFRSPSEWVSFINQHPANIELIGCTRPGQFDLPPNFGEQVKFPQTNQCKTSAESLKIILPYMPASPQPTKTVTQTFACLSPDNTPFTEIATRYFIGMDSSTHEPNSPNMTDWIAHDPQYTYDGMCGEDDKSATQTPPSRFLCHVGVPSQVTQPDRTVPVWQWTCSSGNGGGNIASCSTANLATASLKPLQCTGIGAGPVDLSILVDASASMQPLVDATAVAFDGLLDQLTQGGSKVNYNVITFGGDGYSKAVNGNCPYGELAPFGQNDAATTAASLGNVTATHSTPIASAINYAATMLTNTKNQRAMVVISDGVETCAKNRNITSTIQQQRTNGIKMFGVYMVNDAYYKNGSSESTQSATNFAAMNAYNKVTASGIDNQLSDALAEMLTKATSTSCELSATVATPAGKLMGTLTTASSTISVPPGVYNVTYTLCGQSYNQAVTIGLPGTELDPGLPCP